MKGFVDSYVAGWVSSGLITDGHSAKHSKNSRSPEAPEVPMSL